MSADRAPPKTAIQAAWLTLRDAVNAEYDEYERNGSERELRAIRLAKRLYRSKNGDAYPLDNPVTMASQLPRDGNGWAIIGPFAPAWATYLSDAFEMIRFQELEEKEGPL